MVKRVDEIYISDDEGLLYFYGSKATIHRIDNKKASLEAFLLSDCIEVLLTNTKLRKDIRQQVVINDRSGDFAEVVEGQADVLSQEVTGDAHIQSI